MYQTGDGALFVLPGRRRTCTSGLESGARIHDVNKNAVRASMSSSKKHERMDKRILSYDVSVPPKER